MALIFRKLFTLQAHERRMAGSRFRAPLFLCITCWQETSNHLLSIYTAISYSSQHVQINKFDCILTAFLYKILSACEQSLFFYKLLIERELDVLCTFPRGFHQASTHAYAIWRTPIPVQPRSSSLYFYIHLKAAKNILHQPGHSRVVFSSIGRSISNKLPKQRVAVTLRFLGPFFRFGSFWRHIYYKRHEYMENMRKTLLSEVQKGCYMLFVNVGSLKVRQTTCHRNIFWSNICECSQLYLVLV